MSIQDALAFIAQVRGDQSAADRLTDLSAAVEAGRSLGLHFTADELRTAHVHDWAIRWLHQERANRA
jgi:hypothetical protein